MKRLNFILISLLACYATANAQIEGDLGDDGVRQKSKTETSLSGQSKGRGIGVSSKIYNYELSLGVRGGIGFTTMAEGDGLKFADGGGLNFGGGLAANIRFGGKNSKGQNLYGQGLLGAGLEVNYKNLSVNTLGDDKLNMGYLEVPVMFQVYPCYNIKQLKNLYVEVGPTFAVVVSSSPEKIKINNTTYKTGDFKGCDIKATLGVGYRFKKSSANDGLYVNARYYIGTSNLAGNFSGKLSSFELSVGYLFKCIGTKDNAKY